MTGQGLTFALARPGALRAPDGARPWPTLEEAEAAAGTGERILVLGSSVEVLNVSSTGQYLPPESVPAAGGYVVRRTPDGIDLLLIHRRGAWDLPKGKLDAGESPQAGALREVAEEVGIPQHRLRLGPSLGTTMHGYPHPRRDTYAVKTTHWYAMTTEETEFSPQADEGIKEVEWVPWAEAGERLGFASLRGHFQGVDTAKLGI